MKKLVPIIILLVFCFSSSFAQRAKKVITLNRANIDSIFANADTASGGAGRVTFPDTINVGGEIYLKGVPITGAGSAGNDTANVLGSFDDPSGFLDSDSVWSRSKIDSAYKANFNTVWTDTIKVDAINDNELVLYIPGTANSDTSTFYDYSGFGNDGTNSGTKQVGGDSAVVGLHAISTNGATSVTIPGDTTLYVGTGDFAIETWVYPIVGNNYIFEARLLTSARYYIYLNANGTMEIRIRDNAFNTVAQSTTIPLTFNDWNHVVVNFDRDGVFKVYLNDVLIHTSVSIASVSGEIIIDIIELGRFTGLVDEFRLYTRLFSTDEIQDHYNNPAIHNLFQTKQDRFDPATGIFSFTAGENLKANDIVQIPSGGATMFKADADDTSKINIIGMVRIDIASGNTGEVYSFCVVDSSSWNWVPGLDIYLSEVSGRMSQSTPAGSPSAIITVGTPLTATRIKFSSDGTIIIQ